MVFTVINIVLINLYDCYCIAFIKVILYTQVPLHYFGGLKLNSIIQPLPTQLANFVTQNIVIHTDLKCLKLKEDSTNRIALGFNTGKVKSFSFLRVFSDPFLFSYCKYSVTSGVAIRKKVLDILLPNHCPEFFFHQLIDL